jgi:rfaE bifunctional protein nucleotidyltransferase chain/domain
MAVIFTNGCFDILHRGHVELLKYCKSLGTVVVGLNSDVGVRWLKGDTRPYNNEADRKLVLEACRFVDEVIIFDEQTPWELIKIVKPDIVVKGGDYRKEDVVGNDLAEVKIFNFVDGYSTTGILEKM